MTVRQWTGAGTAAVCVAATCGGCVMRKETIRVGRDGGVRIELEYEGTEEELAAGDAMPSERTGWNVQRTTKEEDDKVKHVLASSRSFAPREDLPRSFAPPGDPLAALALEFPTSVRTVQRPDGLYFYFHRTYIPRRWAYVQYWRDSLFDDELKQLSEKEVDELTAEERRKIVEAMAGLEAYKQLEFARAALSESEPNLPVEHFLVAQQEVLDFYKAESDAFEETTAACQVLPPDEQGDCFGKAGEWVLGEGYRTLRGALQTQAKLDGRQMARVEEAYRRAEGYFKITDQLGGHAFEIHVTMPGTIVGHNGDNAEFDATENASAVTFKFSGEAFRDRTQELIVVSKVPGGPGGGTDGQDRGDQR